jgi:hypothetical protein
MALNPVMTAKPIKLAPIFSLNATFMVLSPVGPDCSLQSVASHRRGYAPSPPYRLRHISNHLRHRNARVFSVHGHAFGASCP